MESSEKIKVALFCAGSHLEEKTLEAEKAEDYISLIGCKKDYFLNYLSLKIGDKTYAVFYDTDKKASRWYKPDAIPSVTNDIGYLLGINMTTKFLFPAIRTSDVDINDMLKR